MADVPLLLTADELQIMLDGLRSLEYWDYATELDLPRRNGEVFLPEDDPSWWVTPIGPDEANAIEQIRRLRQLAMKLGRASGET